MFCRYCDTRCRLGAKGFAVPLADLDEIANRAIAETASVQTRVALSDAVVLVGYHQFGKQFWLWRNITTLTIFFV
jgi:hypothetical protein